ncbi:hypothetical protein TNCV_5015891 [Trichonephila clavipes]|nr:hypothetical protein TNCV_5015891 [Trichonephila clavipes]
MSEPVTNQVVRYYHSPRCGHIWKWEIVNPDDPDQWGKLLSFCIVIGPGQVSKISNKSDLLKWVKNEFKGSIRYK